MSNQTKLPNNTHGPDEDSGSEGGGMGEPIDSVMSLEGELAAAGSDLSSAQQKVLLQDAELELKQSVTDDMRYWERISSACLMADPPATEAQVAKAEGKGEEDFIFREYASQWVHLGVGLDLITDAHKTKQDLQASRSKRKEVKKAKKSAAGLVLRQNGVKKKANSGGGGGQQNQPDLYPEVTVTLDFDPNEALAALANIEEKLDKIEDICTELPEVEKEQREILGKAYEHMLAKFKEPRLKKKYGYTRQDHQAQELKFGGNVPSYFANVSDGSIYRRKVLSIAGLRNLIIYGPIIYQQLTEKHFVGDPTQYEGDVGLALMRRVTGNVVDLDSTVLRCTDRATLNAINSHNKHKKLPVFNNSDEFANSAQATEIATNCSLPMLTEFAKLLKLDEAGQKTRKIHPSQIEPGKLPNAGNNTDRGKWPLWHYVNCGQNSFHCNVPTLDDVNGALLKGPYHCIQLWLLMHTISDGEELEGRIDDFFEHCVVDSCFNMKWKAIEEFAEKMRHEGTITYVLQRVQAANQAVFTADFFDHDTEEQDKEVEEMQKLCKGKSGRDKQGKIRPIDANEVASWVRDPSVTF